MTETEICEGGLKKKLLIIYTFHIFKAHGTYSSWSQWSGCSVSTCERFRNRTCNNPAPCGDGSCSQYGKRYEYEGVGTEYDAKCKDCEGNEWNKI